jgi:hypothetical protein
MIIRNGIVDKVVRYNGWPVQIRNRYNTVGYIPNMTSNTTPAPYVASTNFTESGTRPAYFAFSNVGSPYSFCSSHSPIGNTTAYVQINYGKPISIWKFDWAIAARYIIWGAPTTVSLSVTDDADNILYTNNGIFYNNSTYSGTVTLGSPTKRSAYFRLNLYPVNYVAGNTWEPRFYTFQIYPFD